MGKKKRKNKRRRTKEQTANAEADNETAHHEGKGQQIFKIFLFVVGIEIISVYKLFINNLR